jgi:hypothetical protein
MADFRLRALDPAPFAALFGLDDAALRSHRARWVAVDSHPGYPCRVSLEDALPGERVLLVQHTHHAVEGPYRAAGPIYLRPQAQPAQPPVNSLPASLLRRTLSLRGYDAAGSMVATALVEGHAAAAAIGSLLDDPQVATLHVHNARAGCFACAVERA